MGGVLQEVASAQGNFPRPTSRAPRGIPGMGNPGRRRARRPRRADPLPGLGAPGAARGPRRRKRGPDETGVRGACGPPGAARSCLEAVRILPPRRRRRRHARIDRGRAPRDVAALAGDSRRESRRHARTPANRRDPEASVHRRRRSGGGRCGRSSRPHRPRGAAARRARDPEGRGSRCARGARGGVRHAWGDARAAPRRRSGPRRRASSLPTCSRAGARLPAGP